MSAQIRTERKAYYDMLESTQKGDLDITPWLLWFIGCLDRAFDGAEVILASVMRKARFWESVPGQPMNERQRKVVNRLLDGLEGKLTNAKWAQIPKASSVTALPHIHYLPRLGHPEQDQAGGRDPHHHV